MLHDTGPADIDLWIQPAYAAAGANEALQIRPETASHELIVDQIEAMLGKN